MTKLYLLVLCPNKVIEYVPYNIMTTTVHVIRHMLFVQMCVCVCVCDLSTVSDPIMSKVKYSIGRRVPDSFFFSKSYSVTIVKGEG